MGSSVTSTKHDESLLQAEAPIALALEKLRSRLLDLSLRNRLLNYKPSKSRSLQFVNVKHLNEIYDQLLNGKRARLLPIPEPETSVGVSLQKQEYFDEADEAIIEPLKAREYAQHLGINTDIDLAREDGSPNLTPSLSLSADEVAKEKISLELQALFFPSDLEKRVKKIAAEARTILEETGTTMLHLVFGFLEFYESESSDKPLLAPLLALPVSLERGEIDPVSRVYRYYLVSNEEEIQENFTLREKLKQEFRLHLPEAEENESPDSYFLKINEAIKTRKGWQVRRQLSLGMLSFTKLSMWADLDPERYPALINQHLVRQIFEGIQTQEGNEASGSIILQAEDYSIDSHPQAHLPLIYDADSSQHSVLIDALAGKNIVVNGPPGTGKSQTITNIIAATLAAGKRVLFVAEKLTALEVVHKRLEQANLGHFCLELHSHKTQKKQLLADIKRRMELKCEPQLQLDAKLKLLEEQKQTLQRYATLMGSEIHNALGMSVHEVLWAAEHKRQILRECKQASLNGMLQNLHFDKAETWSLGELARQKKLLSQLADHFTASGQSREPGEAYPWYGFQMLMQASHQSADILDIVKAAHEESQACCEYWNQIESLGIVRLDEAALEQIRVTVRELVAPPKHLCVPLVARMFSNDDPLCQSRQPLFDRIIATLQQVVEWRATQKAILKESVHPQKSELNIVLAQLEAWKHQFWVHSHAVDTSASLLMADKSLRVVSDTQQQLNKKYEALTSLLDQFGLVEAEFNLEKGNSDKDALQKALHTLASYDIFNRPIQSLVERASAIEKVREELSQALKNSEQFAYRWQLSFDGAPQTVAKWMQQEAFQGLKESLNKNSSTDLPRTNALIESFDWAGILRQAQAFDSLQASYSDVPLGVLIKRYENEEELISTIKRALQTLKQCITECGESFASDVLSLSRMVTLTEIASIAPIALLSYRKKTFEDSRFGEIFQHAKADYEKDQQEYAQLSQLFFLDALPTIEDIKRAVRIFRRGDALLNCLKADWRWAKKIYKEMSQPNGAGRLHSAQERANACLRLVAWHEHRTGFTHSDEYKTYLGALFKGVETDFEKIETLYQWYQISLSRLALRAQWSESISLSELDERKIKVLAAQANTLMNAWESLQSAWGQLSKATLKDGITLETHDWNNTLESLQAANAALKNAISFFIPLVDNDISSRRAIELIQATLAQYAIQEDLKKLSKGKEAIAMAAGSEFKILAQQPVSTWEDYLNSVKDITDALFVLENISQAVNAQKPDLDEATILKAALSPAFKPILDITPSGLLSVLSTKDDIEQIISQLIGAEGQVLNQSLKDRLIQETQWQLYLATIDRFNKELNGLAVSLELKVADADRYTLNDSVKAMKATVQADQLLQSLASDNSIRYTFDACIYQEKQEALEAYSIENLKASWAWGLSIARSSLPLFAKAALLSDTVELAWDILIQSALKAKNSLESIQSILTQLQSYGIFDWEKWLNGARSERFSQENTEQAAFKRRLCDQIAQRLSRALHAEKLLIPQAQYFAMRGVCMQEDCAVLIPFLENQQCVPEYLTIAYERVFYTSLCRVIYSAYPELLHFYGQSHEQLREQYQRLDKEIIRINGLKIAYDLSAAATLPAGTTGVKVADRTEMALIYHEMNKTRNHLAVRQLVKRAGQSLLALKPCFMMSPLSVAHYLEQGSIDFDVIIMDEASQLRPEDALGAIARGKQLIVVGDPKQLPPTSFFDQMIEDDDEEESLASVDGAESILDICQQLFNPVRTLKWHYRSQHQSLIAFSNFHFYDNSLVVFPSPYEHGKYNHADQSASRQQYGVYFHYVENGEYKERRNYPEALRVVKAAIATILEKPDESLGLVALNLVQRDLIHDLFDKESEALEAVQTYLARWNSNGIPFFIKNLEHVQGDERDTILISTVFGKTTASTRVRQNFGPISRENGWRRLNVLFTRAKKRLSIFSSMLPEDIAVDEKTPRGTKALRDYLDFARRGILVETDFNEREPDSDFEVSVANVLTAQGYAVKFQLGVAHFFIDLVVRNPDQPGEFLAAIECDGATYHRSASARDRDRIRQEILESLGWRGRIWRIWSADWFYNPQREIERLLSFLNERRQLRATEISCMANKAFIDESLNNTVTASATVL
ncbi:MAG: DUF4011 domain-containing protein [Pseudomonadota bacterium]